MAKNFELAEMTVEELTALIEAAEEQRDAKMDDAKEAIRKEMSEKAAAIGMSMEDLFPQQSRSTYTPRSARVPAEKPKAERAPVAPKYRSPTGEQWSGRGRRPVWMTEAIAAGKGVDDFLIK